MTAPSIRARRARILLVDDDRSLAETLADELGTDGFDVTFVTSSDEAARALDGDFDALVTDLRMPGLDGLELLARSRQVAPERPVIVMTAFSAVDSAIESIRRGAYHYLTKPFKVDELALFLSRALDEARLRREAANLRRELRDGSSLANVVGSNGALRDVCSLVVRLADTTTPVLLLGETGTGKGLFARALHEQSRRRAGPFVGINCAAVPEQLLESELFGHVKGAFTGATSNRIGLMAEADGGTLFLDEIGELPVSLQAKLLHALETSTVRAVGANKERALDIRIVAATHRDLRADVSDGRFREDLLFRLDVVTIEVPPLRRRREDIPALLVHFLGRARERHPDSPVRRFSAEALERLVAHPWPGNVRELANVAERLSLFASGETVTVNDLPAAFQAAPTPEPEFSGPVRPLDEMVHRYVSWALGQNGGRRVATADILGIDRKTLARILGERTKP
jgi:two-component system response regulator HydG